ncbi:MAG: clostripain-related cysteine peptidase [Candidatus Calescibacterium sp.]|nr:clostripain-related cysteine peptidase [Candidatus Calescibacterium sp.]MDW8132213.1 clostripain-related cysteine peptidase [Candidatus Calescibacterium sp.]
MANINNKIVYPGVNPFIPFSSEPVVWNKDVPVDYDVKLDDSYNVEQSVGEEGKRKKWLVIHYGAGDNNLAKMIFSDTDELEKVGSDINTHIVSILDVGKQWGVPFKGARIFYLKKDDVSGKINSPVLKNLGQVNTADPAFMASVLKEIIKRFPADNIAIFIGDHGAGWEGAIEDDSSNGKFMKIGEIREALESVAQSLGKKIDVLAFDACLMAMAEVGYELKNAVKYMVASEQLEGGGGYNYTILFSKAMADAIKNLQQANLVKIKVGPEEFAKLIVNAAKEYSRDIETISAVDLEKVSDLANSINLFAETVISKAKESQIYEALSNYQKLTEELKSLKSQKTEVDYDKVIEILKNYNNLMQTLANILGSGSKSDLDLEKQLSQLKEFDAKLNQFLSAYSALSLSSKVQDLFAELNNTDAKKIREKITKTQGFYGSFRDLKHFMQLIAEDNTISLDVREKAKEVIKSLDQYVIAEFHVEKYPNANGVTIELPSYGGVKSDYKDTMFAKDTKWDEMLDKLNKV